MDSKTVVKAWTVLIKKDELIRKYGKIGQEKVTKAVDILRKAKAVNPFALYDAGFEDLVDVAKPAIYVLKTREKFSQKVVNKATDIYKKIAKSNSIGLYEIGIKKFTKTEILKAYIVYNHYFEQDDTMHKLQRAKRILNVSGMYVNVDFLKKFKGIDRKKAKQIIKTLIDSKIIYDREPYEIITLPPITNSPFISKISNFFDDPKILKIFIKELNHLKKVKFKYRSARSNFDIFRSGGDKEPFFLFFNKRKRWVENKTLRKEAGIEIFNFLESIKGVCNYSDLLKDLNFSGLTIVLNDIELLNANLSSCNVNGIIFDNCNFSGSSFKKSELKNVVFNNCIIENTNFSGSILSNTEFSNCSMSNARFKYARMDNCKFDEQNRLNSILFENANLSNISVMANTKFKRCDFLYANLSSANLRNCTFLECNFRESNLKDIFAIGSSFIKGSFIRADFCGAKMNQSDFTEADLRYATLSKRGKMSCFKGVKLLKANLSYANIEDGELDQADFLGCNLYLTNVEGASFNSAKHISGTEQKHVALGTVVGQAIIHRATLEKKLRDMGLNKDNIHFGSIKISNFEKFADNVVLKKILSYFLKNHAKISKTHIEYNFLNPRNMEDIEIWLEKEIPRCKSLVIDIINEI
jgi:uncharacterized protein YjbI with pentapeptide repeats